MKEQSEKGWVDKNDERVNTDLEIKMTCKFVFPRLEITIFYTKMAITRH